MNGTYYMTLAYTAGLGLFWGYAAVLWLTARSLDRQSRVPVRVTTRDEKANRQEAL